MFLQKISLSNFKSYDYESFEFSERVNCIVGENGTGKTNLLDAIYFLALTKSSISNQDALSINHEMEYMMVEGEFEMSYELRVMSYELEIWGQPGPDGGFRQRELVSE